MLEIVGLLLALLAVLVLVFALFKTIYHLALCVFSIRPEKRFFASLLGPFAFLRKDLFDLRRQDHVKRILLWGLVFIVALGVVMAVYPSF
jgi:hypothetical protein